MKTQTTGTTIVQLTPWKRKESFDKKHKFSNCNYLSNTISIKAESLVFDILCRNIFILFIDDIVG
jgi:CxxC motif-containing protein